MDIMKPKNSQKIVSTVLGLYGAFYLFRYIEYFLIRTDKTIIGEAVLHKLVGIVILIFAAKIFLQGFSILGFAEKNATKKTLWGIGFGISVFTLAYILEVVILLAQGNFQSLAFYVTTYSVDKNIGNQTHILFFLICILGNMVNVVMEEGVFRGLFQKIFEKKYSYMRAALLSSSLFGLWHVIAPLRSYIDGDMSMNGMIANVIMLVIVSGIVGFKFALITKLTGSLYMAMGDHFVNNTIANILHTISNNGADELMAARIAIAQALSFAIVLICYLKAKSKKTSDLK